MALMIIKAVAEVVLFQEDKGKKTASAYINDSFVNESVALATYVKYHLSAEIQST